MFLGIFRFSSSRRMGLLMRKEAAEARMGFHRNAMVSFSFPFAVFSSPPVDVDEDDDDDGDGDGAALIVMCTCICCSGPPLHAAMVGKLGRGRSSM